VKSLSVRGAELSCVDRGQGTPLLLVHGFPLNHTMWSAQIDVLSRQYRVIAPDLRGFGLSGNANLSPTSRSAGVSPASAEATNNAGETPSLRVSMARLRISMASFADDLAAMLDALGVSEPVVFCGLSMGGYIAFQFWRKCAERLRGLILCDTRAAADTPEGAAARRVAADRVLAEGSESLIETMLPRVLGESTQRDYPRIIADLRRIMTSVSPEGIAAASLGMAERPDMTASLPQIRCPTLVIVGEEDAASPPAEMRKIAEAIPNAKFVEIPAAGHLSPMENPAAVNAAILDFLASL
jgi:3-oxoadipate enol-lactonase